MTTMPRFCSPPFARALIALTLAGFFCPASNAQAPAAPPAAAPAPAPPAPSPPPAGAPVDATIPLPPTAPVQNPGPAPTPPESTVQLGFPNASVNDILSFYEMLTDKRLVRDSLLAQGSPLTIVVPGQVPRSEAIRLIEASLLLNGYTLVPVDDKTVKVLGPSKFPRAEGIPIYSTPYLLPNTDQVVSYFMKLSYLSPQEAAQLFQTFVSPPKAYTSFTPVPNVQAVLITENVPIIQQLIALQAMVDVPPAQVMTEFISLKRADAEKVVELLQSLFEQRKEGGGTPGQPGSPNPGGAPQVDAQGQVIQASIGGAAGGQFESNLVIGETQFVADPRTNRILVVTRPVNFPYIKQIIEQLDAAVPLDSVLERPLRFVSARDVLPVLSDLLSEGEETSGTGTGAGAAGASSATVDSGSSFGQGMGSDSSGGIGGGGTSRPDRIKEPTADVAPESVIIGKTKLIADKSANSIIVIGPPDSRQKVAQLLDMLDVRPRQVYIAAVIGELQLTDEMEFGFNYFLRNQSKDGNSVGGALLNRLPGTNILTAPDLITPASLLSGAFSGLTLYGTIANSLDYYVRALETTEKFRILSRPVVYTTNNKKAVISSGQRVPYTSSTLTSTSISGTAVNQSAGVTANITYLDILLKLEVLPLINANKDVTLVIVQTNNNDLGEKSFGAGNSAPIISAQELTTTVTVPSGGTVVLGGLIIEKTEGDDSGLPFIMRIPVLGYLFKQTTRAVERRELLVLLQPTVVENDAETALVSAEERYRTKLGDEVYDEADAWSLGRTPVVNDSPMLTPDSRVRKPRDPLRPAGVDYQEYAPPPKPRPTPQPTPAKKKRSAS